MFWIKVVFVKVRTLAGRHQVYNMWMESEKRAFSGSVVVAPREGGLSWCTLLAGLGATSLSLDVRVFLDEQLYGRRKGSLPSTRWPQISPHLSPFDLFFLKGFVKDYV
jgi:hypothetical protein